MYIADALLRAGQDLIPPGASLFAVEETAIMAAGDLRIESAMQMERLSAMVIDRPDPCWIEWPIRPFFPLLSRVSPVGRGDQWAGFSRLGVLITPADGRADVRTVALAGKAAMPINMCMRLTRGSGPLYKNAAALRAACAIDPRAAALVMTMEAINDGRLTRPDHVLWMAHRLTRITDLEENMSPSARMEIRRWGAMAATGAIALSALVALDAPEIRHQRRNSPDAPVRSSATRAAETRLSIVTLRLTDRDLHHAYTGGGGAGTRESAARHMVKGHMFLARNGKMTWRRPHWRGDAGKRLLYRVV